MLFILFLFIWALYLPKEDITTTLSKTIEEQKHRLDLYFQGVTFNESLGGIKYWEIKAKSSSLNKDTGIALLEEANGIFFKNGRPVLKFISPHVLWNMNKKEIQLKDPIGYDLKLEGKIKALLKETKSFSTFILPPRYGEGYFFKAKILNWKLETQKIICSGGIYLKKGEIAGVADRLEADVALEMVNIFGKPCVINLINKSLSTLEADQFSVNSLKDEMTASGEIILTAKDLKLTADELQYRQRENTLYFRPTVEVTYLDARAKGNLASYHTRNQEIILTGNVSLKRKGSHLTGDKVLVSLKNNTFKVTGKTRIVIPEEEIK